MPVNDTEAELYNGYEALLPKADTSKKLEALNSVFLSMRGAFRTLDVIEPCADDESFHGALQQATSPEAVRSVIEMHYDPRVSRKRARSEAKPSLEPDILEHVADAHQQMHDAVHQEDIGTKPTIYIALDDADGAITPAKRERRPRSGTTSDADQTKVEYAVPREKLLGAKLKELRGSTDTSFVENDVHLRAGKLSKIENGDLPLNPDLLGKLLDYYGVFGKDRKLFEEMLPVAS